jgi:hypothetical protein
MSTFANREVPFNEHPSLKCAATDTALASDTRVFHNALFFRSLNSAPHLPHRRYRISSCP